MACILYINTFCYSLSPSLCKNYSLLLRMITAANKAIIPATDWNDIGSLYNVKLIMAAVSGSIDDNADAIPAGSFFEAKL